MSLFTLFMIAVGLSMDAFAVSICKGLALKKITVKNACLVGLFQTAVVCLVGAKGLFLQLGQQGMIGLIAHAQHAQAVVLQVLAELPVVGGEVGGDEYEILHCLITFA